MEQNDNQVNIVKIDENHIIVNGEKYVAKTCTTCTGCELFDNCEIPDFVGCSHINRSDKTSVIWVKDVYASKPYDEYIHTAKEELEYMTRDKPVRIPSSWEEFCKMCTNVGKKEWRMDMETGNIYPASLRMRSDRRDAKYDKEVLPSKEMAEAFKAMMQLVHLRDYYNNGWIPNWHSWSTKHVIKNTKGHLIIGKSNIEARPMAFKTATLCDMFFHNFKNLLEIAKPLL